MTFTELPYMIIQVLFWPLFGVLSVYLAFAVRRDARWRLMKKRPLFLVGDVGWLFITLLSGGLIGVFLYWLIHYSSMRYLPHASE